MGIHVGPGVGPTKSVHRRARPEHRRADCGKPTNSHKLTRTVMLLGSPVDEPVIVPVPTSCPDCGETVIVPTQAVQCHACFEKKAPEEL